MRILDNYIFKSVIGVFFVCFFTFLSLYVIIDILSYLEDILRQHITLTILIKYYLSYLPIIFVQVAPFSCLLSTLYTFAKLNQNNEIIAMRASGLSIFGVTKTVIIFGFIISMVVFLVNDRFVPFAASLSQKVKYQITNNQKKNKEKESINNLSMYGMGNKLFFVDKFSPATNTMEGIIILEQDKNQNITKKIVANKGVYTGGHWVFYQSITYEFDTYGQITTTPQYYEEEVMSIAENPEEFLAQRKSPDLMNISQLNEYIWKLSKSGATTVVRNLSVDLYQRYTMPLISLIIILLGIPCSLKIRRRATGISSIGIAIILAFSYYVLNAICIAFGKSGLLLPIISASLSHIIAICLSLYLIFELP
ncbi:MAG: LptF/LptG family permease [Candidatus Omnitrophota bacterium]